MVTGRESGAAGATGDSTTGVATGAIGVDGTSAIVAGREAGATGAAGASTTGFSTTGFSATRGSTTGAAGAVGAIGASTTGFSTTSVLQQEVSGDSTTGFSTTSVLQQEVFGDSTTGFPTIAAGREPAATGATTGFDTSRGDDMFCAMLPIARRIEPASGLSSDIDDKKRPSDSGDGGLNDNGASPLASATRGESAAMKISLNCIDSTVISPASLR